MSTKSQTMYGDSPQVEQHTTPKVCSAPGVDSELCQEKPQRPPVVGSISYKLQSDLHGDNSRVGVMMDEALLTTEAPIGNDKTDSCCGLAVEPALGESHELAAAPEQLLSPTATTSDLSNDNSAGIEQIQWLTKQIAIASSDIHDLRKEKYPSKEGPVPCAICGFGEGDLKEEEPAAEDEHKRELIAAMLQKAVYEWSAQAGAVDFTLQPADVACLVCGVDGSDSCHQTRSKSSSSSNTSLQELMKAIDVNGDVGAAKLSTAGNIKWKGDDGSAGPVREINQQLYEAWLKHTGILKPRQPDALRATNNNLEEKDPAKNATPGRCDCEATDTCCIYGQGDTGRFAGVKFDEIKPKTGDSEISLTDLPTIEWSYDRPDVEQAQKRVRIVDEHDLQAE